MTPSCFIELRDAGFAYPGRTLWHGLNLTLQAGQIAAVVGPNGAGKTTLIRCLAGLTAPTTGEVVRHGRIGYVPQHSELTGPYSVAQVVAMGRAHHLGAFGSMRRIDREAVDHSLHCVELTALRERTFSSLSGGERQRVLVARALAQEAHILILDEPMAALDLRHQVRTLALLKELGAAHEMLVVFSTHVPQHALSVATRTLMLGSDRRLHHGATSEVLTEARLEGCFGVPARMVRLHLDSTERNYVVPLI